MAIGFLGLTITPSKSSGLRLVATTNGPSCNVGMIQALHDLQLQQNVMTSRAL